MVVSEDELDGFRHWLLDQGRSDGTVRLYLLNVKKCMGEADPMSRLTRSRLAAKTLHTNRAALRAWADYREDTALAQRLRRVRLPPARRARAKKELARADWQQLARCLRSSKMPDAVRAVITIMLRRGLRCGDVLRIRKREIADALRTGTLSYEAKGRRRLEYKAEPIRAALEELAKHPGQWECVEDLVVTRCRRDGLDRRRAAAKVVSRALARCAKAAGVAEVHPHRLRRSYATYYLEQIKNDPKALLKLQQHMGWASMATAAQYVDALSAAELDDIADQMMASLDE